MVMKRLGPRSYRRVHEQEGLARVIMWLVKCGEILGSLIPGNDLCGTLSESGTLSAVPWKAHFKKYILL